MSHVFVRPNPLTLQAPKTHLAIFDEYSSSFCFVPLVTVNECILEKTV